MKNQNRIPRDTTVAAQRKQSIALLPGAACAHEVEREGEGWYMWNSRGRWDAARNLDRKADQIRKRRMPQRLARRLEGVPEKKLQEIAYTLGKRAALIRRVLGPVDEDTLPPLGWASREEYAAGVAADAADIPLGEIVQEELCFRFLAFGAGFSYGSFHVAWDLVEVFKARAERVATTEGTPEDPLPGVSASRRAGVIRELNRRVRIILKASPGDFGRNLPPTGEAPERVQPVGYKGFSRKIREAMVDYHSGRLAELLATFGEGLQLRYFSAAEV